MMTKNKELSTSEIEKLMENDPWWKEISEELDRLNMLHQFIIPDEDKNETVQAMLEYLFISKEDLARAQTDPVFQEAKTIIDFLKPGDLFPDRLFELYESKIPDALERINKAAIALIDLVSNANVRTRASELWTTNKPVFASLDMNKLPSELYVSNADDRYILRSLVTLQGKYDLFQNYNLNPFGSSTYRPAAVSELSNGQIQVGMGAKNKETEGLLNERRKYLTYRVFDPLWDFRMTRFEPGYVSFRLKWINDTQLIKHLYDEHKAGKDVVTVFMSLYEKKERLTKLKTLIASCPITAAYGTLFGEAVDSYEEGRFGVSATSLLPMIEGIIWEFAWWWNRVNGGLFDRQISRADYMDSTKFQLLKEDGSKIGGRPNIGSLLRQTKFGQEVYFEVVEYLVGELFEERNPALHGRDPNYGNKKKAAALLFVVETLERQITDAVKKYIGKNLSDSVEDIA